MTTSDVDPDNRAEFWVDAEPRVEGHATASVLGITHAELESRRREHLLIGCEFPARPGCTSQDSSPTGTSSTGCQQSLPR